MLPYDRERGHEIVDRLRAAGDARGASPAQVALAWLLTRPAVSSILVGASNVTQLDDNLAAVDLWLEAEDLAALDKASEPTVPYPQWFTGRVADGKVHEALGITLSMPPLR